MDLVFYVIRGVDLELFPETPSEMGVVGETDLVHDFCNVVFPLVKHRGRFFYPDASQEVIRGVTRQCADFSEKLPVAHVQLPGHLLHGKIGLG